MSRLIIIEITSCDEQKNWVNDICVKKESLYDDMMNYYRYKTMVEALNGGIPMDICQMLRLFAMQKYQNRSFILELHGLSCNEDIDDPPRKRRK